MKEYLFKLTDKVRDYECDLQGVVNNSNYQHYMEHTRHEFLESLGENFGKMHEKGVDGFVSRVEIQYKTSLKSGDSYISCLNVYKKGVKLVFEQDIYRASDNADDPRCIQIGISFKIEEDGSVRTFPKACRIVRIGQKVAGNMVLFDKDRLFFRPL